MISNPGLLTVSVEKEDVGQVSCVRVHEKLFGCVILCRHHRGQHRHCLSVAGNLNAETGEVCTVIELRFMAWRTECSSGAALELIMWMHLAKVSFVT